MFSFSDQQTTEQADIMAVQEDDQLTQYVDAPQEIQVNSADSNHLLDYNRIAPVYSQFQSQTNEWDIIMEENHILLANNDSLGEPMNNDPIKMDIMNQTLNCDFQNLNLDILDQ
jgi:hypothetical protein